MMLVVFNDYWAFSSAQVAWIDKWLYPGYFLHLKAQLLAFPYGYYGDRLSVLLPGWVCYHLFGPFLGNYVFKLTVICTALFSTYAGLRYLLTERAALIAGLVVCAQPYFLIAFGWDYVDGIGIAYYSLSMFFALRAARSKTYRLSLFICGVCCNLLITSHFLWLNLVWIVPLGYFLANRSGCRHSPWKSLALLIAGFLTAFCAFCAIHYALTGNWFYLSNTMRHTLNGFGAAQQINIPISKWIYHSTWMVHYNGFILLAVWLLLRGHLPASERLCLIFFVVSYVTVWLWQFKGFPFAMLSYYTSFLFPSYAVGIAGFLNRPLACLTPRAYRLIALSCVLGSLFLYWPVAFWDRLAGSLAHITKVSGGQVLWTHPMIAVAALCFCIMLPVGLEWKPGRVWPWAVLVAGFFVVYALQLTFAQKQDALYSVAGLSEFRPAWESYSSEQGWFAGSKFTNKQAFHVIVGADAWINKFKPDRRLLWWSDRNEPGQGVIYGVTSLYLWNWSMLNESMPNLSTGDIDHLSTRHTVAALSWKEAAIDAARAGLIGNGFAMVADRRTVVREGSLALHVGLFSVRSDAALVISRQGLREIPGALRLEEISTGGSAATVQQNPAFRLTAVAPKWSYLAYLPLQFRPDQNEVWIRLHVEVLSGQVGFGILNGKQTDFYARKLVDPGGETEDVLLYVARPNDSGNMIIETGDSDGKVEVIIRDIAVFERPGLPVLAPPQRRAISGRTNATNH
jgi:hypothetical protein